ncbi:MAG: CbiX/SirB N-terminal domain-containing protein [Isosphaeraceae bacterium]
MSDALLIAAHGSRDAKGVEEFWAFAEAWQQLRPDRPTAAGFLEFARPTIAEAIDDLVARDARQVTVVPAMLWAAGHVKNDVPSEIQEARERHPLVLFRMARPLDLHPALLELCHVRFREAAEGFTEVPDAESLLLLVGRGTSDPDANANVARVSRFLWESYGVGWATVGYSGLASPSVDEALTVCRKLGYRRIIVQPYFLFDGVLVQRIVEAARRHAEAAPDVQWIMVPPLQSHPLLIEAFEARAHEAVHGSPRMNCDLCKYRVRLIGREDDLGVPQEGHHHHVRAARHLEDDHAHRLRRAPRRPRDRARESEVSGHPWDDRLLARLSLND